MLDDFDLDKDPSPTPPAVTRERRPVVPLLVALVLALAAGAAVWFFLSRPPSQQTAATPQPKPRTEAAAAPVGIQPVCVPPDAEAAIPPLDDSDAFAKKSASGLSGHPRVAAWLATDNVIRNFVVAVDNVASGGTPAARMRTLRPTGAFRVRETPGGVFIDPRSFDRYTPIADAVDSIDAQDAAQLCGMLKPRLSEAYAELGREGSFEVALERAIVTLLRTPIAGPDTRLVPDGATYAYEDDTLESLTPAQKQLVRMGPRNARLVQDKLRQIALAIGIPADRLP